MNSSNIVTKNIDPSTQLHRHRRRQQQQQQEANNQKKKRSRLLNDVILNCYQRSSYYETHECTPLPLDHVVVKSKSTSTSIKEEDNNDVTSPPPLPTLELKRNHSDSPTSAMHTSVFDQQDFNKELLSSTVLLPDLFYDDYENENDYEESPKYYYEDKSDDEESPNYYYEDNKYDEEEPAEDHLMDTSTTIMDDDASRGVDPCIVATVIHNAHSYVETDTEEGCNDIVVDDDGDIDYLLPTTTTTTTANQLIQITKTNKKKKKVHKKVYKETLIKKKINMKQNSYTHEIRSTSFSKASLSSSMMTAWEKKSRTKQPRPVLTVPPRGMGPITDPNTNDVLCGRGGRINLHAGNVQFRDLIQSTKQEYLAPSTRKMNKAHIAARIVTTIRTLTPPGRFLKKDRSTGMWFEIGDAKAIKKTGQALREDALVIRPPAPSLEFFDEMEIDMETDDSSFLTILS